MIECAGRPLPLGATWDGEGVNFAIFSRHATGVALCLYDDPDAAEEAQRLSLQRRGMVWHTYLAGIRPGQLYGYRVDGPYAPHQGHHFNPAKLLIDPYAKAVNGVLRWHDLLSGGAAHGATWTPDLADSASVVPKCVVVDATFDWQGDRPPRRPWDQTVLYEAHVKGMTQRHPAVPEEQRGTYLGLACDVVVDHLLRLGVTAIQLLPVQQFFDERHLVQRGLPNYWGYSPIAYFAPEARYAMASDGAQVQEFKTMVRALHRAGIEVILDVVYNHTGEGNQLGPTLSVRGVDNASYYRLDPRQPEHYLDTTGCGNALDTAQPSTLQLMMDSLRYWVADMHVDGFRFDLAPALARDPEGLDGWGRVWSTIQQDPLLREIKLIVEPWDLGSDGYQLGRFPPGWSEWNDRYRDNLRRFWRGQQGQVPELAARLTGSSDVFEVAGRGPAASINYVTCHDGFTLHDLVSYEQKHNQDNGEENRDGTDDNLSRNWGVEGPSDDPGIVQFREQMKRNILASLALSLGVPMIAAGDELGRTQQGNNNAYCQDNDISWINWQLQPAHQALLDFAQEILAIRRNFAAFARGRFYRGVPGQGAKLKDVTWLRQDGAEMTPTDWDDPKRRVLGMLIPTQRLSGEREVRHAVNLLLLLNAGSRTCRFRLPSHLIARPGRWKQLINTARRQAAPIRGQSLNLAAHSLQLLVFEQPQNDGCREQGAAQE